MLAKSLVIFIGIGVLSGLGFGLYLIDAKNTNQLVYVDGPSISVVTEKSDFKKGEEIKIRIVNSGTSVLTFSDSTYGVRITGLSGILMYSPQMLENIRQPQLEPNDEIEVVWNQIKNDGDLVLEGLYKISVKAITPNGDDVERSTTITVWK